MKQLWVEKYRPADIEGYVFRDETQREQVKQWIKEGAIPHLNILWFGRHWQDNISKDSYYSVKR